MWLATQPPSLSFHICKMEKSGHFVRQLQNWMWHVPTPPHEKLTMMITNSHLSSQLCAKSSHPSSQGIIRRRLILILLSPHSSPALSIRASLCLLQLQKPFQYPTGGQRSQEMSPGAGGGHSSIQKALARVQPWGLK